MNSNGFICRICNKQWSTSIGSTAYWVLDYCGYCNNSNVLKLIKARQWRNGELIELVTKALQGKLTRQDFPLNDKDLNKLGIYL